MITLFRRVRKTLLQSGNARKYALYALGEIALVVVGILIALQINNWNEERKFRDGQQKLFSNLKLDFEDRLAELEEFLIAKNKALETTGELYNIIAEGENLTDEVAFYGKLAILLNNFLFNESFIMLEVLFNTGLINDIRNEELKRRLIKWPVQIEEMLEEQRIYSRLNAERYKPLIAKYIAFRKIAENFNFRNYGLDDSYPISINPDIPGLLSDPHFENIIAEQELLLRVSILDNETLIQSAKEIIELLEAEL